MSHLTTGQRALLEQTLQRRRHELESGLHTQQQGQGRAGHAHEVLAQDGDDAPQRDSDREVSQALGDMEQRELTAVSEALQRIDSDAYGACAECGTTIPFDRLKVEPWALRCTPCEAAREARHGGLQRATL